MNSNSPNNSQQNQAGSQAAKRKAHVRQQGLLRAYEQRQEKERHKTDFYVKKIIFSYLPDLMLKCFALMMSDN